ncbi:tetratricopeptide repeat protein [Guyparkeria hydrothermalis]|uniref:LysM peptidoglycan-binding domain-containing protein n=1 Tax=Guyparkeria hydrothermalis TaxID=923 RepID=UPI00202031BB|nr:tetratricopeptide repeat protein [Guyparkeria hydrothermalis]MCL7744886.1 tetratricopeptide repeat protein [Guyparkeria hydrothermalis]
MTRTTRRIHIGRTGLIGLLAVLSAGCAQLSTFDARLQELTGQSASTVSTVSERPRARSRAGSRSLDRIQADLQRGEYRQGRRDLDRYLARHPDDEVARSLLRQLEADPEQVLGEKSRRYVVQSGDSYSALADRHLGDPALFLLLARYNQSTNPSALRVGEAIRLPVGPSSGKSVSASSTAQAGAARRSLDKASRPSGEATTRTLPDSQLRSSRASGVAAEALQRRGLSLLEQGKREEALQHLEAALEKDPSLEPAASRVPQLRSSLVEEYHQRAILRYRNQKLGDAIALWNRVLAIDPTFEPARSYRARARELQRRLADL